MPIIDRRRAERFSVLPAYTPCKLRTSDEGGFQRAGHVHDVSRRISVNEISTCVTPEPRRRFVQASGWSGSARIARPKRQWS